MVKILIMKVLVSCVCLLSLGSAFADPPKFSDHIFRTQTAELGGFKYTINVVASANEGSNNQWLRTGASHIVIDKLKRTGRSLRETVFPCNDVIKANYHPMRLTTPLVLADKIYVVGIFASPTDLTGKYKANQFRLFELVSATEVPLEETPWMNFSIARHVWPESTFNDDWVMERLFFDLSPHPYLKKPGALQITARFRLEFYRDKAGNEVILEHGEPPPELRFEEQKVSWFQKDLQIKDCAAPLAQTP
jgi:hypothetical protein